MRRFGRLLFLFALAVLSLPAAASGQASYQVPQDNPSVGRAAPESYALGLRNPFRWSFDRTTVSEGDGGGSNDDFDNAQNLSTLLGKPPRIDPVPGASPAGAPTIVDTRAPLLFTRTKRGQRVLRLGGVVVYARCPGEACNLWITARVRIGRLSYPLKRVRRSLARNSRVRLMARLTRRARRVLRKALHDGKRAKVDVAIRAQDRTGNPTTVRRVPVRVRH